MKLITFQYSVKFNFPFTLEVLELKMAVYIIFNGMNPQGSNFDVASSEVK